MTAARLFGGRRMLAVHYRAQQRDKQAESIEGLSLAIDDYVQPIDRILAGGSADGIFLLSDLAPAVEAFRQRYGTRMVTLPRLRLAHADQLDLGLDQSLDGHRLALEVLEDAYLAAACDLFLGDGASGVSCCIAALKDWPEGALTLLRRNVFQERRGRLAGG
jgi:hypothetical protein